MPDFRNLGQIGQQAQAQEPGLLQMAQSAMDGSDPHRFNMPDGSIYEPYYVPQQMPVAPQNPYGTIVDSTSTARPTQFWDLPDEATATGQPRNLVPFRPDAVLLGFDRNLGRDPPAGAEGGGNWSPLRYISPELFGPQYAAMRNHGSANSYGIPGQRSPWLTSLNGPA